MLSKIKDAEASNYCLLFSKKKKKKNNNSNEKGRKETSSFK